MKEEKEIKLNPDEHVNYNSDVDRICVTAYYLQNLNLEGWMWEFLRRNSEYQALYMRFKQLSSKCKFISFRQYINYAGILADSGVKAGYGKDIFIPDHKRNVHYETFFEISMYLSKFSMNFNERYKSEKVHPLHFAWMKVYRDKNLKGNEFYMGLPNPDVPYKVFGREMPIINGATSVKHRTYFDEELWLRDPERFNEESSWIVKNLLHGNFDNTLFLSISKKARVEEIEKELKKILKNHIVPKKTRMRPKEWIYYLIVFDLKKNKNTSELINLLIKAFPFNENIFDEKNINNYYKNALVLIDGGYKEFLTYSK